MIITNETVSGAKDGKISGLSDKMEYSTEKEGAYNKVTGTEITGLSAGTYWIRYSGTETHNPSEAVEVTIQKGEAVQLNITCGGSEKFQYGDKLTASGINNDSDTDAEYKWYRVKTDENGQEMESEITGTETRKSNTQ